MSLNLPSDLQASLKGDRGNIFADLPNPSTEEIFQILQQQEGLKIERIISTGQATPAGEWYDQPQHEWILLLSGSAGLRFDTETTTQTLHPGDFVNIPAHQRHRVEWTDPNQVTIWLAIHYSA
jgi:cupin 2 domain-containing protein